MTQSGSQMPKEDFFTILIATDNHLGYLEKDVIRGDDSFVTFEEILQRAVENEVDFILLGGDLFHDTTPSSNSLHRCLKLLKTYTLGGKTIDFEFLSDQSLNFYDSCNKTVNYEDPNINVSIPVFSIHGNHDDPSGLGRLSVLDILSTTGLINYFGKWTDLNKVEISPILLKKSETQLSLYGLSHIHDNRLARLFRDSQVIMEKPEGDDQDWFNLMVLHQNRANRGLKNYLPEDILPNFLDLIIWGHEHDCRIKVEENRKNCFFVCQPGSSVATSLSDGESRQKHCGILKIHKKNFVIEPIILETVRPFVFDNIDMTDFADEIGIHNDITGTVQDIVKQRIEEMLKTAKEQINDNPRQPKKPLIRLRIMYQDEDHVFNALRFGQQYTERVANPLDMILFKKLQKPKSESKSLNGTGMNQIYNQDGLESLDRVEDLVEKRFEEADESNQLEIVPVKCLTELTRRLVDCDDKNAADKIVDWFINTATDYLMEKHPAKEVLEEEISNFKLKGDEIYKNMLDMLDKRGPRSSSTSSTTNVVLSDDDNISIVSDQSTTTAKPAARGRGRGRGRGAARGANATTTPAKSSLNLNISSSTRAKSSTSSDQPKIGDSFRRAKKDIVYEIDSD